MIKHKLPQIDFNQSSTGNSVKFSGYWFTKDLGAVITPLKNLIISQTNFDNLEIEFTDDFKCDTAGAWLLASWLGRQKLSVEALDKYKIPPAIQHLLNKEYKVTNAKKEINWSDFVENVGKKSTEFMANIVNNITYLGEIVSVTVQTLKNPAKIRWTSIFHHLFAVGMQAFPIIALISFLIGAVLAYQGINQLSRFGASVYTVDFLAISLIREIAVLLTSVVIAGRSGSAFTAQIGTMALNQEIDAIRMLGLNPTAVLAIPRVIALTIALPVLVFFAIIFGLLGGMVVTRLIIDMSFIQFWQAAQKAVSLSTFFIGMSKAPLFAIIISVIGCYRGMQVKGSAESVGNMTTRSVVESIFMVIICDAIMSIFFSVMEW